MQNAPRVLIIGCGYLGCQVGSLLLGEGFEVVGTTTRSSRAEQLTSLGLRAEILDLEEPGESAVWTRPYQAVVYAVAPRPEGDPRLAFQAGVLDCARRLQQAGPPGRFIHISSTGVYHQDDGQWVTEESPARPVGERHRFILKAEEELLSMARQEQFPALVLRLGGIYGPGRSPVDWLRRPEMNSRILRGSREAFMNWIHLEDAALAVVLALHRGRPGEIYLVVDDEPVPRGEFYRLAAEHGGVPSPELPSTGGRGKRCSNKKARDELGFRPTHGTYREGLSHLGGDPGAGTDVK